MKRRAIFQSLLAILAVLKAKASSIDPAIAFAEMWRGQMAPLMWLKSSDGRWIVANHITKRGWIESHRGRGFPEVQINDYRAYLPAA